MVLNCSVSALDSGYQTIEEASSLVIPHNFKSTFGHLPACLGGANDHHQNDAHRRDIAILQLPTLKASEAGELKSDENPSLSSCDPIHLPGKLAGVLEIRKDVGLQVFTYIN